MYYVLTFPVANIKGAEKWNHQLQFSQNHFSFGSKKEKETSPCSSKTDGSLLTTSLHDFEKSPK